MLLQSSSVVLPFIGSEVDKPYNQSQVVILPISYEATTTYRQGCRYGPAAILEASDQLEYYDIELDWEICWDVDIYTHSPIADSCHEPSVTPEEMLAVTKETTSRLLSDGKFVIALGGEHSITAGIIQGYQEILQEPFTIVQIDAHGDLRYEYEGSIYNHACVMRRIRDMGLPTLGVGIRSICAEEAELIKEQKIPVIWARDIVTQGNWIEMAIAKIPTSKVFITIDLDGLDPTLIPGVGTPEPGGLDWYTLTNFLRRVFATHEVIGCDVMELAPVNDSVVSQFSAAKLVYKLIGYQAFHKNR